MQVLPPRQRAALSVRDILGWSGIESAALLVRPGPIACPPAVSHLKRPGDSEFKTFKFDVLRIEQVAIAEITGVWSSGLFPKAGLPVVLSQEMDR
jgi:hypothetical protein